MMHVACGCRFWRGSVLARTGKCVCAQKHAQGVVGAARHIWMRNASRNGRAAFSRLPHPDYSSLDFRRRSQNALGLRAGSSEERERGEERERNSQRERERALPTHMDALPSPLVYTQDNQASVCGYASTTEWMIIVESPGGISSVSVTFRPRANCCMICIGMASESTYPPSGEYCE